MRSSWAMSGQSEAHSGSRNVRRDRLSAEAGERNYRLILVKQVEPGSRRVRCVGVPSIA